MLKTLFTLLAVATISATGSAKLEATVLSFGTIVDSGGSFDYLGNTVTVSGSIIYGVGGAPPPEHGDTGTSGTLGGSYTGDLFVQDAGEVGLPVNTTRLSGVPANILGGNANDMDQFVGFHVHFSEAVPVFDFFMVDLDGAYFPTFDSGNGEYAFSFAFNDTDILRPNIIAGPQVPASTLTIATDHNLDPTAMNTAINNLTLGVAPGALAPATVDVLYRNGNPGGNLQPDDYHSQALFSYNGALATDLFFAWGVYGTGATSLLQNSGITGLEVVDSTVVIPEPSRALLSLMGIAVIGLRRRRS